MDVRSETQAHIDNIMDCIHGGEGFIEFKMMVEDLDAKASKGDVDAAKAIDIIVHFSKFIDVAKMCYRLKPRI